MWKNVAEPDTPTTDNITRRLRFAYRISYAPDTHSEYVTFIVFHGNSGYTNVPQYYVTRTLPVLF